MRFGLLAADDDAMRLVAAAASHDEHQFAVAYDSNQYADELLRYGVVVKDSDWVDLLHAPECDAVVVGRGGDEDTREDQLRKLVQAAVPLIVVHPTGSMLLCFELQMIQQDTGSPIVPYFPGLEHPLLWTLAPHANDNNTEGLQQVLFERENADTSKASITDQFSRDALLLRRWVGRIDRVGALGTKPYPSDDWGNLSVHMTSQHGALARWTASPLSTGTQSEAAAGHVTSVRNEGKSQLQIPIGVDLWRDASGDAVASNDAWSLDVIDSLAEPKQRVAVDDLWEDACRAVELADTLDASYRRGKTIDLYHEKHTEEETFKGMMAAGGCLAMMCVIMLLPALAAVDSLKIPFFQGDGWKQWPWSAIHFRAWPFYLLAILSVFLGLQFLRLVFRSTTTPKSDD